MSCARPSRRAYELDAQSKRRLLDLAAGEQVRVRTDARVSPTGFPFKVAEVDVTLSDSAVYEARPRLCDLGVLRSPYRKPDGDIGYRCPAEPVAMYVTRRGGRMENTAGRCCAGGRHRAKRVSAGIVAVGLRSLSLGTTADG